jgi:hypothetical protein
MTTRTSRRTVTFTQPFALGGMGGMQPPGDYVVETDEETIDALSFVAWRNAETRLHVRHGGTTQVFTIDRAELEAALSRDSGISAPSDR